MIHTISPRRKELALGVFLLAMTVENVVTAVRLAPLLRAGYQNFTISYAAGQSVRSGESAALYDLAEEYEAQRRFAPDVRIRQGALPYNHPPFEALLFVPLTFLPYTQAYLLWTFLNVGMLAASLIILRRQLPGIRGFSPVALGLAGAGFVPVASAIIQGQDSILLMFLAVLALAALDKNRDVAAGVFLAAGLFRFHLIFPLALILAARRWRLLLGVAPVAAALAGVSLAMVGWRGVVGYMHFIFDLEKTGAGGAIVAGDMPNLRGLFSHLPGLHPGGAVFLALTIACSVLLILLVMWLVRTEPSSLSLAFTLATVAAILVSYHTLAYDLSLLLPVVMLLASAGEEQGGLSQADTILFALVYLLSFCDSFWPRLVQLWFVPVVFWVFWKLGRGQFPDDSVAAWRWRKSTTSNIGR